MALEAFAACLRLRHGISFMTKYKEGGASEVVHNRVTTSPCSNCFGRIVANPALGENI